MSNTKGQVVTLHSAHSAAFLHSKGKNIKQFRAQGYVQQKIKQRIALMLRLEQDGERMRLEQHISFQALICDALYSRVRTKARAPPRRSEKYSETRTFSYC